MRVVFSEQARDDLREIAAFIRRDDRRRALSFVTEIRDAALMVGEAPLAFPLSQRYAGAGLRQTVYGRYLILYAVGAEQVAIINIQHSAREIGPSETD